MLLWKKRRVLHLSRTNVALFFVTRSYYKLRDCLDHLFASRDADRSYLSLEF